MAYEGTHRRDADGNWVRIQPWEKADISDQEIEQLIYGIPADDDEDED